MLTNADDISVVFSGGAANINPNDSLGGEPSAAPVVSASLNNLFNDVSAADAASGLEDFRCIYLFNDGSTPIYSIKLWISQQFSTNDMELGVENVNEVQRITMSGVLPTGGSITLSYLGHEFTVNFNSDLGVWALAIQNALNTLVDNDGNTILNSVIVKAQNSGPSTIIFDISFTNLDAARSHASIMLASNNLMPTNLVSVVITTPQSGAPINTIAPEIDLSTTPPGGVTFSVPTSQSPIILPTLRPNDGFPLWVKRVVAAGSTAVENDGFTLTFQAQSLE